MTEIAIKDPDKTPMWSVPGTKLFLSFENPGPISIDVEALTPDQKKIIAYDLSRQVLVGKETDALFTQGPTGTIAHVNGTLAAKSYAKVIKIFHEPEEGQFISVQVQPKVAPAQIQEAMKQDLMEDRKTVLSEFLDQHVATVKKDLPGKSLSELRILKDIELQKKKRPSVISLIDALVSKAQSEVFAAIQKSQVTQSPKPITPTDLPAKYLENVTGVVESDHRDVTIKLGADDE